MEEDLRPFKAENFGGWTQTTTEPIEVATVDGMKPVRVRLRLTIKPIKEQQIRARNE